MSDFMIINFEGFPFGVRNKNKMPTNVTSTQNHNASTRNVSSVGKISKRY